jgi:hypothetical protein
MKLHNCGEDPAPFVVDNLARTGGRRISATTRDEPSTRRPRAPRWRCGSAVAVLVTAACAGCATDENISTRQTAPVTAAQSTTDAAPPQTSVDSAARATDGAADSTTTPTTTATSTTSAILTPTTQPGPTTTAFAGPTRQLELRLNQFPSILLTAPQAWDNFDLYGIRRSPGTGEWVGIVAAAPGRVFRDPCKWIGTGVDPGRTVDEVVAALTTQPLRNPTKPVPVNLAGYDGMYFEWSVPDDQDFRTCDGDSFRAWLGAAGPTRRSYLGPGQYERVWVLDVGQKRPLVLLATYWPGNDAAGRTESDKILAGLTLSG